MRLVLRIGGSVVASPINSALIYRYVDLLKDLRNRGHKVAVIVGGGAVARDFIRLAKDLGLDEKVQDNAAISVSRIFARLLLEKLGDVTCKNVPLTITDAKEYFKKTKIVVVGGLRPGITTDTVAALIAEKIEADLYVKATDQDGIYDKDPRRDSNAIKLERMSFSDLSRVLSHDKHQAGIHQILDPEAVKILKKGQVKVVIVNGFDPRNVSAAIEGKKVGTSIE